MINTASKKALSTSFNHVFRPINKDMILHFRPLDVKHLIHAVKLMTNSFLQSNPICLFLKPSENAVFSHYEEGAQRGIEDNMAIMCLDSSTNNIVGVLIACDDYNFMQKPLWNNIRDPNYKEWKDIGKTVREDESPLVPSKPYEIISTRGVAVDASYAKNGIAKELYRFAIKEHPIISKAEYVRSNFTNPIAQKISQELGYKIRNVVVFDEYKNSKGEQPFKGFDKFAEEKMGFKNFKHIEYSAYKV